MHRRWPRGPIDKASHMSVLARICMWPKKVLCDVWITNFTILMWHVPRKPKSPDNERGVPVHGRVRILYMLVPPTSSTRTIYHHNTNKKDSTLLVKLSDGRRPRGPTESVTRQYRVSCRTTFDCMWPKHLCMTGLCIVLNNKFTTLMWHRPA